MKKRVNTRSVFSTMPSLLRPLKDGSSQDECWELPNIFGDAGTQSEQLPRKRKAQKITACPHKDRKHYAKHMCNNCYHKLGRARYAWACPHPERKFYAKGQCQLCYLRSYHQAKRRQLNS